MRPSTSDLCLISALTSEVRRHNAPTHDAIAVPRDSNNNSTSAPAPTDVIHSEEEEEEEDEAVPTRVATSRNAPSPKSVALLLDM